MTLTSSCQDNQIFHHHRHQKQPHIGVFTGLCLHQILIMLSIYNQWIDTGPLVTEAAGMHQGLKSEWSDCEYNIFTTTPYIKHLVSVQTAHLAECLVAAECLQ